jgi:asparagine synthase (glutamine-hydrolysing)
MYGMDSTVKMLNGMFAIVIADIDRRLIYIARDRIGIIPCHIMVNDKRIIWGSEIKAFLELKDFDRKINLSALSDAVKYCYPNSSMYKAVKNVEPGTYYTYSWDNNKISRTVYFSLEEYKCGSIASLDECEEILRDCLKRQLVSDVPLGVQLSGGVDSTLLAKYTSDIYQSREQKLYGFSLVNRGHPKYSEEGWIDHAAKSLTVDLQKFDFNERVFAQNYEKSLYAFERFVNIPSPVGIYTFSSQARKNVTVLISGEGADELAGGYGTYSLSKMYGVMEKCLGKRICSRVRHWAPTTDCDRFIYYFDSMLSDEACKRIFPAFDVGENIEAKREFINSISGSYFEKLRKLYFKEELVSLLERQNKICMANSVENRVPFLDNRFIELVFSLNEDQLVHPNFSKALKHKNKVLAYEGKYLLKQMSERIYGKEFAFRNKQAVRVPLAQYMMYPIFHEYLDSTIISGMKNRGLVDMNEFKAAYENMDKGENEMIVWKAINMEVWMQLFADGRKVYEIL